MSTKGTVNAIIWTVLIIIVVLGVTAAMIFKKDIDFAPGVSGSGQIGTSGNVINFCSDTDRGLDINLSGTVAWKNVGYTDYCINSTVIREYYCMSSEGPVNFSTIVCPQGQICDGGACKGTVARPAPAIFTLTVFNTNISRGLVYSIPSGIFCGTDCTENYTSGTTVILNASAFIGSRFGYWWGCDSILNNRCIVYMNRSRVVVANFTAV